MIPLKDFINESKFPKLDDVYDETKLKDSVSKKLAAEALSKNREAYWSKTSYNNQMGSNLLDAANKQGLEKAVEDTVKRHSHDSVMKNGVNLLIPLNKKAEDALKKHMKK